MAGLIALIFIRTFVFLWVKSQPQPVVYEEFTPESDGLEENYRGDRQDRTRNEVNVKPQISGIITQLLKQAGNFVQQGEVIAKVKVIPDMSQLSSAEASFTFGKCKRKKSKVDYSREKVLYDKGPVSADEYDKIHQSYKQAQEEVSAAEDNLEVVRDGVQKQCQCQFHAHPQHHHGRDSQYPQKVGNSVFGKYVQRWHDHRQRGKYERPDLPRGNIDETEVGSWFTGMPMKITIGALQNMHFDASLEYISPKAVESNGANQFEIKAAVSVAKSNQIRSGYSANAEIVLASANHVLTVPESAIEFSGNDTYVYVIKGSGDKKTYERRRSLRFERWHQHRSQEWYHHEG